MPITNEGTLTSVAADDLSRLAGRQAPAALSMYMKLHRAGSEKRQNAIRFKNIIKLARRELEACKGVDVDAVVAPIANRFDDAWFNRAPHEGLAIFRADGDPEIFAVSTPPDELVVADDRLYVRPLVAQLQRRNHFYLLALSMNAVRCLEVTIDGVESVSLPNAPANLSEAIGADPEKSIQFHSGAAPHQPGAVRGREQESHTNPAGSRPAVYHGQGAAGDDAPEKRWVADYCHQLDDALREDLPDRQLPLMLAGVDWVLTWFRDATTWSQVAEATVEGNVEHMNDKDLADAARKVVREHDDRGRDEAVARYRQAVSAGQAADELNQILQHAANGRIDSLLVTEDAHAWGAPPAVSEDGSPPQPPIEPNIHDKRKPGDVDWLEHAVVDTLRTSGSVYPLPRDQMPDGKLAVAALRY